MQKTFTSESEYLGMMVIMFMLSCVTGEQKHNAALAVGFALLKLSQDRQPVGKFQQLLYFDSPKPNNQFQFFKFKIQNLISYRNQQKQLSLEHCQNVYLHHISMLIFHAKHVQNIRKPKANIAPGHKMDLNGKSLPTKETPIP